MVILLEKTIKYHNIKKVFAIHGIVELPYNYMHFLLVIFVINILLLISHPKEEVKIYGLP